MPKTSAFYILSRTITQEYYRLNTGFFFFIFILFVLAPSRMLLDFHMMLLTVLSVNLTTMFGFIIFLILYHIRCLFFVYRTLNQPENEFLHYMVLQSRFKLFMQLLGVQSSMSLIFSTYSLLILGFAFYNGLITNPLILLAFQIIIHLKMAYFILLRLESYKKTSWLLDYFYPTYRKGIISFYLIYLLQKEKVGLFLNKLFSYLVISWAYGYAPEMDNRFKWMMLVLLVIFTGHSYLIGKIQQFEEEQLSFLRNLPLTIFQRFLRLVGLYICLLIPEILILTIYQGQILNLIEVVYAVLIGLSMFLAFHCVIYIKTDHDYLRRIGVIFFFTYLFIMLEFHPLFISLLLLSAAFSFFYENYYEYEFSDIFTKK